MRWDQRSHAQGREALPHARGEQAIARASRFDWHSLACDAEGVLDKVDRVTQFTRFDLKTVLTVPEGTDRDKARQLLEKAERSCLITNSMKAESHLQVEVRIGD